MDSGKLDKELLEAYRAGSEDAAAALFKRYFLRLTELVRAKRGGRRDHLEGTSDVAQSVFRSFFRKSRDGEVNISDDSSLWPYLATITLNKVKNRVRFWNRQRRDQGRHLPLDAGPDPLEEGPSPEEASLLEELLETLLAQFSPRRQKILQGLLDGKSPAEIAEELKTSLRTIYSTRLAARDLLNQTMKDDERSDGSHRGN